MSEELTQKSIKDAIEKMTENVSGNNLRLSMRCDMEEIEEKLKPLLTEEFLSTLAIAVKTCGWTVDHVESTAFVRWCFDIAGKDCPNLDAF